jgi:peptidoglycan/xylan/chitin deacetylase (PgdA/CDA1 family)
VRDVLVLCYHAVSPGWNAPLSVTPDALEAQLSELVRHDWRGSTFTEAVLRPPHPRTLAVTFDDGFLSVLERGEPILTQLGLPATMFVPTSFMGERQPLVWQGLDHWSETTFARELDSMDWDDLCSLRDRGWEIGAHTCTHPHLTLLDNRAARAELEQSRLDCEEHLECPCTSVAYPYGDVDDRIMHTAAEAGFDVGASLTRSLAPGGPLRWPRVGIYHGDRFWRFRLKANVGMRQVRATRFWPAHD